MSELGIYFGPKLISVVQTQGKKILNSIQIPLATIAAGELEGKVPDEIKIVALFKDKLRKNKIVSRQASLALSGKDLVIRTFEMPVLPRQELGNAINFEAKKYLPFKPEELILDHQLIFDKASNKNLVLLVGIKKETLNKYLSIFTQLNLELTSIEYSAFSILRLLSLAGTKYKGVIGIISADLKEEDEINFTVLENGFPLFSRDITLPAPEGESTGEKEIDSGMRLEKLKTEARISLDYYHRKFPTKGIEKVLLITGQEYAADLEAFLKEMGLASQFLDLAKPIGKPMAFSLSFLKGYSISLAKTIKIPLKINLLTARPKRELEVALPARIDVALLIKGLHIEPRIFILGLLICAAALGVGLYQKLPLQKELTSIRAMWPQVSTVNPEGSFDELTGIDSAYKEKIETVDELVKKRLYLTSPLDIIPRIIPEGIWLENFSFKKEENKEGLTLQGMAYLGDSSKEFELVNSFLIKLKEDSTFVTHFKEIKITSLDTTTIEKATMTKFVISCQSEFKERE